MDFELMAAKDILSRTPLVLTSLLQNLPDNWVKQNEGPDTWSPFDVVGHLILGDLNDWIPRVRFMLEHGTEKVFEKSNRFAQLETSERKSLNQLLEEFSTLRNRNLSALDELGLTTESLSVEGRQPGLGAVTIKQVLSTWVVHDLGHIGQIVRTMAKQHASNVGPWAAYLRILGDGPQN